MYSHPLPTHPRYISYTSEYTKARSNPHSISDAFGTRPNSHQQQRTLKGHTDEPKQAPSIIDAAGVRVTSYHDEPGYFNRSLGKDSVNDQERARPPSVGGMAANRPKSEYDNHSTYVHVKPPPSQGKVRELNPSYEDNDDDDDDDDEDDYQRPPPISLNGYHYGMH